MNAAQIHATFKTALQFLAAGQLKKAFEKTELLVDELQMGEYSDKLNDIQQNYSFLLQYYVSGVQDPQRKSVYNKLVARTFSLNAELREELLLRNSSNFEYTQKRYFPFSKKYRTPSELLISLNYFHSQWALISKLEDSHEAELKRLRSNYETALNELFSIFWLSTRYQAEEKALFAKIMQDDYPGWLEKTLVVSGIMMNLWRMFDESKLALLFDACQSGEQHTKQRALVAICFTMARHNRFLTYFPAIRNRLVLLTDESHIVENLQNIFIQIIATSDTDKITKKMKEEILPEMMKMSPKIKDKLENDNPMGDEWNEENPEWRDMLDENISDKLKELSELQMEGADVYMSTFSLLKSFPFFSTLSNWYLPFDSGFSTISELFRNDDKSLLTAFVNNNVMCNSDKYSFCLSILQMPESQRGMLKQSFKMESEQMDEMAKDEALLTPEITAKNISKQYIQDLFRFFKLHPQHADFSDMFGYSLILHKTYLYDILGNNDNFKESIAEYYFSKSHYSQALEVFESIVQYAPASAALYQKIGYSYQQSSQFDEALAAYQKADLIQPDDLWTLKKMALCCRMAGNYGKALEYYQHTDFLKPDQKSIQMQMGHCMIELGKFKEALALFFKLDALEEEDIRVWRAISWCSFVSGNISQAAYYSQKIIEAEPTATDYLNAGHIAWCGGKLQEAIGYYQQNISLQNNKELFVQNLQEDKPHLLANGIDADEIPLLLDALNL